MNELMVHVERIVRPLRATAGRKLRMRRELLAHLEAALAEERAAGGDEAAALERAKRRLGAPEELRRQLQASVPLAQRVLLGRIPAPGWYERWEKRAFGFGAARMTMLHSTVVSAGTFVALVGAMLTACRWSGPLRPALIRALGEQGTAYLWGNVAAAAVSMVAMAMCYKLVAAIVAEEGARRVLAVGAVLVGLLQVWVGLITNVVAALPLSAMEVAWGCGSGVVLVGVLVLLGQAVAVWRRPYREWMELELAE